MVKKTVDIKLPLKIEGDDIQREDLESYLDCTNRFITDLLSKEELEHPEANKFTYKPKPIKLPGLQVRPQATIKVETIKSGLSIELTSFTIPGARKLEKIVSYDFSAIITANNGWLDLRALARLDINEKGLSPNIIPSTMKDYLAKATLGIILGRLMHRCRTKLPKAIEGWLCSEKGG